MKPRPRVALVMTMTCSERLSRVTDMASSLVTTALSAREMPVTRHRRRGADQSANLPQTTRQAAALPQRCAVEAFECSREFSTASRGHRRACCCAVLLKTQARLMLRTGLLDISKLESAHESTRISRLERCARRHGARPENRRRARRDFACDRDGHLRL